MISVHSRNAPCPHSRPFLAVLLGGLARMLDVARQRRHLSTLSDWQLKDIGLSRADVAEEIEKPFWQV